MNRATTWALSQSTGSPARKIVLMALADYADQDGVAWPSRETLARDSEQSVRSVDRRLLELQDLGLLEKLPDRFRPSGGQTTNAYRLIGFSIEKMDAFLRVKAGRQSDYPPPSKTRQSDHPPSSLLTTHNELPLKKIPPMSPQDVAWQAVTGTPGQGWVFVESDTLAWQQWTAFCREQIGRAPSARKAIAAPPGKEMGRWVGKSLPSLRPPGMTEFDRQRIASGERPDDEAAA